jgi:hypothetical protein
MAWATFKALLLGRVRLINQEATWFQSCDQSREEFPLKKVEDHHNVILFKPEILNGVEVADLSRDGRRSSCLPGVLLCLPNTNFRDIDQLYLPVMLSQPDCMAAHSACDIQGFSRPVAREKLIVSAHQKRIGDE